MISDEKNRHWAVNTTDDGLLWLILDRADASVNAINSVVFEELNRLLDEIIAADPKGVILLSGKANGFIAGADIKQFETLKNSEDAFKLMRDAQKILDKLEALPMPTVAMINGFCLGGGLEIALACRYRVAEDSEKTRIGLPEVKLGIHPGWGGTVRLPRLIGAPKAMEMMLPGAVISAATALKWGVIDAAVPARDLKAVARYFALEKASPHQVKRFGKISNSFWIRPWLGRILRKKLEAKVKKSHYAAPYAIVDNWVKAGVGPSAMEKEAKSIAQLILTENSRNLVHVFFLQERLKSFGKISSYKPLHIHVIGAGTMGGDIAAWCALSGFQVTLQDQTPGNIGPAIKRAYALYEKKLKVPRLIQAVMDRLQPDVEGQGIKKADVVIEAVFEDLKLKQELFRQIEPQLKPDAILATNTSSIPLDELQKGLRNPDRLLGIHFFNPVSKMPLVEVVYGEQTSAAIVENAMAFVGRLSKFPLPVKSQPGFLVNRLLMPYLLEAVTLLEEGWTPEQIDAVAVDFGMPMGPVALSDKVGLDICLSVAKKLATHFHYPVPERLVQLVEQGHLGVKTGKGFYEYRGDRPVSSSKVEKRMANTDVQDRLILCLINEAVGCVKEKIVENADLVDVGMILGTGFAPFRGGPLRYAKQRGLDEIQSTLSRLAKQYGPRFAPKAGWELLSVQGGELSVNQ